jgi:RNA polymerase sigma-70 factor (ECF subfamily)
MSDQKELIDQVLKGNPKAQKALYDSHAATMLGVCYRYCKSLAEAEDMLQEGFVKVFKNLSQFKGSGELGAWIRRIMVNTAINEIKKSKLNLINREDEDDTVNLSTNDDPEILLTAKEIASIIQLMPDGYRVVFNLHAIEGYTHNEIASLLNIKPVSVRSQYQRARMLLAALLQKAETEKQKPVENEQ